MVKVGALVAYKGKPAKIVALTTHKFELNFSDGASQKVREKDFRYIHPEFTNVSDQCPIADLSILKDLQVESLSLKEITEWLFDDYSSQNAWCTNLMAEEGLYFFWNTDKLLLRSNEQVNIIEKQRHDKALQVESLQHCVVNLKKNRFDDEDTLWIKEIEQVALNKSKHAKVLSAISMDSSPENAHQLLLNIKYWSEFTNPYPDRHKIFKDEDLSLISNEIVREDLTQLRCYAIDNIGSSDADDAIGIEGELIWIHIADVASQVEIDSELDIYAQKRASNLYLPEQIIHMLPPELSSICSLGQNSNALSISFKMVNSQITNVKIIQSAIKVTKITYEDANKELKDNEVLSKLSSIATSHKAFRNDNGAIKLDLPNVNVKVEDSKVNIQLQTDSKSREMVAEMMIIAGRAVAQFANENNISMPFLTQEVGSFSEETISNKENLTFSQAFKATRNFKRSKISTKPLLHAGLGLAAYVRVTSPIRRYLDLLVHQQLVRFINKLPTLNDAQVKDRIKVINVVMPKINKVSRQSIEHFKCLYLKQNNSWHGRGIIVELQGGKATVLIPEIAMMTQIKLSSNAQLEDEIKLKVGSINLVSRLIDFKPL